MPHALLVLAAGVGTRYGGLKQMDPVGPAGETVLDYAVFDALRAGFSKVVFVIRRDIEAEFRGRIGSRYVGRAAVEYVIQSLDDLPTGFQPPAGREKPWGTGHAVWCARKAIRDHFAVVNADDFYGADSFSQLARFLDGARAGEVATFAMIGFRLDRTLSEHGAVSRGVCRVSSGRLVTIAEATGISKGDAGPGRRFSGAEIVSMNCWAFTPAVFSILDEQFREFLSGREDDPRAEWSAGPASGEAERKRNSAGGGGENLREFYLPAAVAEAVARRKAEVWVIPTSSTWMGMTYKNDKPRLSAEILALASRGVYPPSLF